MPDLEKKIEAHKWAATIEAGENVPFEHELFTRNLVVQATDEEAASSTSNTRSSPTLASNCSSPKRSKAP